MNNITISGKAWTPEVKCTQSGMYITEVSVSVYDGKDKDTQKAKYFSVKVKAFKELAENIGNQIAQGDNVVATGRLTEEKWDKDGVTHRRLVLIADSIGKEISRFGGQADNSGGASSFGSTVFPDEEVPF